jgi:HK97 family phage prohead protease
MLRRDKNTETFRRFLPSQIKIREVADENATGDNKPKRKRLTMLASTSKAVDWGGYREILEHKADSVDYRAAHALLLNHDPNRIIGSLVAIRMTAEGLEIDADLIDGAKMDSGISVVDAIESGALRGVSIGYHYTRAGVDFDEESQTVTVRKWRLLENSLTPIPADDDAALRSRSLPDHFKPNQPDAVASKDKHTMKKFMKWLQARGYNFDQLTDDQVEHLRKICEAGQEPAADYAVDARTIKINDGDETSRARDLSIAKRAESYGLKASAYMGKSEADATEAMLRDYAEKNKTGTPTGPMVSVVRDEADGMLSRAKGALYAIAGLKAQGDEAKEIRGYGQMPMRQLLRSVARHAGIANAEYISEAELAAHMAGCIDLRTLGRRDAPNKVVANFSTLLANVAEKTLRSGFENYNAATWNLWTTQRNVANFLQVSNVGLSSGRLTLTPESETFPELNQKDGGYNSALGMYGATISLSFQALVNDEFGQILRDLKRAGYVANETIDREAYVALLNATWTNDVSAASGLATSANLDKPRAALKAKLSPAGTKLGITARYLLHDTANAVNAQVATGAIYGQGQVTAPSMGARQIIPIESHWIGDTALLGGALTTDYYVTADPNAADTVLVNLLEGVGQNPIIMPYDAGAVAAEKYKIVLPFKCTVATHADSAAVTRVSGMQKATVA